MRISDWSSDVCSSDLLKPSTSNATDSEVTEYSCPSAVTRSPSTSGRIDRKSVVLGKSVSVRVVLGGRRIIKKKRNINKRRRNIISTNHTLSHYISLIPLKQILQDLLL